MFRSTIDYEDRTNALGCCCKGGEADQSTFSQCVENGGYFRPLENGECIIDCPNNETTGHCCACANMSEQERNTFVQDPFGADNGLGVTFGITPCECTRLGGNWSSETEAPDTLCYQGGFPGDTGDVRWPSACCSYDGDTPTCHNTCSPAECAGLGDASIYFNDGSVCGAAGPEGQEPRACSFDDIIPPQGAAAPLQSTEPNDHASSCLWYNVQTETVECSRFTQNQCDIINGFFVGTDYDLNPISCAEFPANQMIGKSSMDILSITEQQCSDIPVGSNFYNLGIYCGIFEPGTSMIDMPATETGYTSTVTSVSPLGKNSPKQRKKVAVIMSFHDFGWANFGNTRNRTETSSWSGHHNIYASKGLRGDLVAAVKNFKFNGVEGWTIPSVEECAFIQQNMIGNSDAYLNTQTDYLTKKLKSFTRESFDIPSFYTTLTSTVINKDGNYYSMGYNFVSAETDRYSPERNNYRTLKERKTAETNTPSVILGTLDKGMAVRLVKTIEVV